MIISAPARHHEFYRALPTWRAAIVKTSPWLLHLHHQCRPQQTWHWLWGELTCKYPPQWIWHWLWGELTCKYPPQWIWHWLWGELTSPTVDLALTLRWVDIPLSGSGIDFEVHQVTIIRLRRPGLTLRWAKLQLSPSTDFMLTLRWTMLWVSPLGVIKT